MKVSEAVDHMSKAFLHRVIDSFTRDFPKTDEERSREIILRNVDELTDPGRIRSVLTFSGPFSDQILLEYVVEALVNRPDCAASEAELIDEVTTLEKRVLDEAKEPDSLRYDDPRGVDVLRAVLEVALEDREVSDKELSLIRRLRDKLELSEKSKRIILAQLKHFPRPDNQLHTTSDFRDVLIDLQRRGVVFYCNKLDGGKFVVPHEMVGPVKAAIGIELSRKAYEMLLDVLTKDQLATALESRGLPKSGLKEELQTRVLKAGFKPSATLETLSDSDLYEICSSLPGAKISGTKSEKVERIIDYFANLVVRDVPAEAPPGERYYQYLVELAARDRENLLANKVIRKDRDMEWAFEEGTRYLFREKLGLELLTMPASDHCDGCMRFGKRDEIFMWDNKSKEAVYTFPPSHLRQFKRYIRDSHERVSCFLIIAPAIADEAEANAARLKIESGTDTDVALIAAEDLVWLAERWSETKSGGEFNLDVLNITGILSRPVLEQRLKLFT